MAPFVPPLKHLYDLVGYDVVLPRSRRYLCCILTLSAWWSAMLNSFIHVLMYTHYLMVSLGSSAPWKKYLTMAQMIQFLTNLYQSSQNLLHPNPDFPAFLSHLLFYYMITMLVLFGNYFLKEHRRTKLE
jgi:hypothetical protein